MFKAFLVALFIKPIKLNKNPYLHNIFNLYLTSILILVLIGCNNNSTIKNIDPIQKDSITIWIKQSTNSNYSIDEQKLGLKKAYESSKVILNDSIKLHNYWEVAYEAENLNYDDFFLKVNKEALSLSLSQNNLLKIGEVHWNYGLFYTKKEKIDSSYFHFHKAYESFERIDNKLFKAKMLFNLGFIQGRIKDYTGSEISIYSAIEIYKELRNHINLYRCYNYLGLIYSELEEFDRAVFSHNTALEYLDEVENKDKALFKEWSLSNLGLVYQKQKVFNKAIENFELALENERLKTSDLSFYARLKDNIAYSKFLKGDTLNLMSDLNYALNIRDSLNNHSGVVISKRHLSELFVYKKDTISAIKLANEAYKLASDVENNRDKLETLLLL